MCRITFHREGECCIVFPMFADLKKDKSKSDAVNGAKDTD